MAQLVEQLYAMREVVSSTTAGPTDAGESAALAITPANG